ncbi:MAG: Fe-S cluster assembly protein SufD [Nanoarchaeota archaeon]|nr:Fe-S cluster assembly protein SufD [Nanoarchaeota archaeon]
MKLAEGASLEPWTDKTISEYRPMSLAKEKDYFTLMHGALWNEGFVIRVKKNTEARLRLAIDTPAHLVMSHVVIFLDEGAILDYQEDHTSSGAGSRNDYVEIYCGPGSILKYTSKIDWKENVSGITSIKSRLDKDSSTTLAFFGFGGDKVRNHVSQEFAGEGSSSRVLGAYFGRGSSHLDLTADAHHLVPNTTCNILYKGALSASASSVFRGKIKIEKEAQNTNSFLEDHCLILSPDAVSDSIPSLEIDANEVKASHGATIGKPDEEEIFYLMARGIAKEDAERLIISGFFSEIFQEAGVDPVPLER